MLTDKLLLISIAVLTVVVLLVLGMVLYFAAKRTHAKPSSDPKVAQLRFDSLRSSFRQAVELIEGNIATRSNRYSIPWIMVLNEGDEHRQLPIAQSGVSSALSVESASAASAQGISWNFFDRGVVIDIQGAYLGSPDDNDASEKPWDEFLGLCRAYRPQRPFDSVVITIPASLLLDDSPDGRLEIAKRAKLAHRRLWLAQNRFAMRFAVYVLVTGTEKIEGFSAFSRSLPESMRSSMLGWSSPYDLSTTYQSAWVDEAMGAIVQSISDTSAELFATGLLTQDAGDLLLLPSRMDALRSQLQLYVDELMRPSAYHEPFFFRGIYATGDSSASAEIIADVDASREFGHIAGASSTENNAENDLIAQLVRQPTFLRDLFEKKIFLEYGLTRPSKTQALTRPVMHRALRWGAVLFVGGWSVGLVVATWQLHQHNKILVSALNELQNDARLRTDALRRAETIPAAWYRNKALSLVSMNERLRTDGTRSFFMPGSWRLFDDLHERVVTRIEREFAEIAVTTLRREMLNRVSQLSGVEQDETTGDLIVGASCRLPPSFASTADAARKSGLLLEDQPEFTALQRYLNEVDQLDAALQAMDRLSQPTSKNAEDLRLAMRYALGADLPIQSGPGMRHFYQVAAHSNTLNIPLSPIQDAMRCTLGKATEQLDTRMFKHNELLLSEAKLQQQWPMLSNPVSFQQANTGYRDMIQAIKTQDDIVSSGKGGWMRQPELALGASYDRTLARIAQNRLLGQESASGVQQNAQEAFQRFRNDFNVRFGGAQASIVWQEKEGRFVLSPERIALRDALSSLLNQPFMQPPRNRSIAQSGGRMVLNWDAGRLDQALAQGEVRSRYFSEGLSAFPSFARTGIERTLNAHFARLIMDQVADAATPESQRFSSLGDTQATAFDASRQRLSRVQSLLEELGAPQYADDLRLVLSQDALTRLRIVDNTFTQSDLYSMRVRESFDWQSGKSPVFDSFGVSDAASLQSYFAQQFDRLEVLGRQAEIYMGGLDAATAESPLAQRWQGIQRELERYKLKNPNSSLLLLEQFLLTSGAELNQSACVPMLSTHMPSTRVGDFFSERHSQIHASLTARCLDIHFREQRELWNRFAKGFNQGMAGYAPFAPAADFSREVISPAQLPALLDEFDQVLRRFKEARLGNNPRFVVPGQAAHRFAAQFERVRDVLAPAHTAEENAPLGYDLLVDLRSNVQDEVEGSKIIEWSLSVGDQVVKLRDPQKPIRWTYGTPIALVLRIAKDAPVMAQGDTRQSHMTTDGHTVTYHFNDPWSLFTLMHRHRDAESVQRQEARSQRLRFEFPLQTPAGVDPTLMTPAAQARVFMRMTLHAAGKNAPLTWPTSFPTRAPEWSNP